MLSVKGNLNYEKKITILFRYMHITTLMNCVKKQLEITYQYM